MVDYIYNLWVTQVDECHQPKKKSFKFTEKMHNQLKQMKNQLYQYTIPANQFFLNTVEAIGKLKKK